jgi:cell division protein FtsL
MVRIVKKKKVSRAARFMTFACNLFVVSVMLFLCSSLFLRSYNNSLSAGRQSIDEQIADIQIENDAMQVEIRELASSDRVDQVTSGSGLAYNQNNITTISGGTAQDGE